MGNGGKTDEKWREDKKTNGGKKRSRHQAMMWRWRRAGEIERLYLPYDTISIIDYVNNRIGIKMIMINSIARVVYIHLTSPQIPSYLI